jgi:ribosome biogenesis protein ERB1
LIHISCSSLFYESQVVKLVRAIRAGLIKPDQPKEEQRFYHLWGDDSSSTEKAKHLNFIPAPKPKLPGIDF